MRGQVQTVSYTAPSERKLFMEYYADPLKGRQPKVRSYTYTFDPPGDIAQLTIGVRQPKDAVGFRLDPAPLSTQVDNEGFTEALYRFSNVKAGTPIGIRVTYSRPTWAQQVPKGTGTGAAPTGQNAGQAGAGGTAPGQSGGTGNTALVILIAIIFSAGMVGVAFIGKRPVRVAPPSPRSRSRAGASTKAGAARSAKSKATGKPRRR